MNEDTSQPASQSANEQIHQVQSIPRSDVHVLYFFTYLHLHPHDEKFIRFIVTLELDAFFPLCISSSPTIDRRRS